MKITHVADTPLSDFQSHRARKDVQHQSQVLLEGEPGTPNNFELMLAFPKDGSTSPRHSHNFDQFRYAYDGPLDFGPLGQQPKGTLGYYPEGTPYGPFTNPGDLLSAQVGGPSGYGLGRNEDHIQAMAELREEGEFEGGMYIYTDANGNVHKKDSYEAVWERASGKTYVRPKPRYQSALIVDPESYQWIPIGENVSEKVLGVFNERGTGARMLKFDVGGEWKRPAGPNDEIYFVVDGSVNFSDELCVSRDAVHLKDTDATMLSAPTEATLLVLMLPNFTA